MTATANHILIADDEPAMRRLLSTVLSTQGYTITEASSGSSALGTILTYGNVDLLLLDLSLPDCDGLQIIRDLRTAGSVLPIVVLSSRSDEDAKVAALDLGADDYVTKPFGARELLARVRAALRHRLQMAGEKPVFRASDLTVDHVRRIVTLSGREVKLTPKEYALLSLLVSHAGKVLTHKYILEQLWTGEADAQYTRIYIRSLRQKLGELSEHPRFILTEQGVGYRFVDPEESESNS
jgi:two-component system, OmpR family, KDP operon response regulator KdpE